MNYEFCNGYTYTIKQGDTLYEISKRLDVPLALILRANPYVDVFNLQIGDTLCIPAGGRPVPPPPMPPAPGRPVPPPPMPPAPGRPVPPPPVPPAPGRPVPPPPVPPAPGKPVPPPPMPSAPGRPLPPPPMPSAPGRPLPPKPDKPLPLPNVRMSEEKSEHNTGEDSWIRYVVQPGDTLSELVRCNEMFSEFIDRNGAENIYMLPGIAYYIPEK